jgi:hypothetical protein
MKLYAFVQFETNEVSRYGNILDIGYVTESILKSNIKRNIKRNKRVKVYGSNFIKYVQRNKFITISPLYCILK